MKVYELWSAIQPHRQAPLLYNTYRCLRKAKKKQMLFNSDNFEFWIQTLNITSPESYERRIF